MNRKRFKIEHNINIDLKNHLLSLHFSGSYITNGDIAKIGEKLGYETPLKSRDFLLNDLMAKAKNDKIEDKLKSELIILLDTKKEAYLSYEDMYKNSADLIDSWVQKIDQTKKIIDKEFTDDK